jgi:2-oxoglutarate ferredoxin oxidoreductase subunit beta
MPLKQSKPKSSYYEQTTPNWCPGCGNFGIWVAVKNAIKNLDLDPAQVVLVGDIGCSGKLPYWTDFNGFAGLHGRALPIAEGIKMANRGLTVIAITGDGGLLNEGVQHFIHAARRNADINVIMHNNQLYGLTKGQTSATSEKGFESSTTPEGSFEQPINPVTLGLTAGASFIGSSFAGNTKHATEMIETAIKHRGFSYVDIYQPCVTYNYINTYAYYSERTYVLPEDYNPALKAGAFEKSFEIDGGEKYPLGVIYQETRRTLEDELLPNDPQLVEYEVKDRDVSGLFHR